MKKYLTQSLKINFNTHCFYIPQVFKFSSAQTSSKNNLDLIKILRQETNSPLNHIRKALEECQNDIEEAKVWLKKKGFKDAENKKSRSTNVKLIGIKTNQNGNKLAYTSVSCETEFVANTDYFKDFSVVLLETVLDQDKELSSSDYEKLPISSGNYQHFKDSTISDGLKVVISKTQENCSIGAIKFLSINENQCVGTYLHNSPIKNLGVKGSYVILQTDSTLEGEVKEKLTQLANNLAMHIVAANSKYLRSSDVPEDVLEKEKAIIEEQIKNIATKNKENSKILSSKLEKWYQENVLLQQTYLILDYEEMSKPQNVSEVITTFANQHKLNNLEIKEFKLLF